MAFDAFLKIDGIIGESTDAAHTDWIDVLGFEHSAVQPSSGDGSLATGRIELSRLNITKKVDLSTPVLYKSITFNDNLVNVELQLCRATGEKQVYYKVTLTNARVAGITTKGVAKGANASPVPVEVIELAYATIDWEYSQFDHATGAAGGVTSHQWDTNANITT